MFITAVCVFSLQSHEILFFLVRCAHGLQFLEYTRGTNPSISEVASLKMRRSQHAFILVLSLVSASQVLGKHRIGGTYR